MTFLRRLAAMVILVTAGAPALAQEAGTPVSLGQFTDWGAWYYDGPDGRVCYIISRPTASAPQSESRDQPYIFITNWPNGVSGEVYVIAGYAYQEGSFVIMTIDSDPREFRFFTQLDTPDSAWIENRQEEATLIQEMRAGINAEVVGTSRFGTVTTDTYSLRGITNALNTINQECPA
jgi:hypothetical protein